MKKILIITKENITGGGGHYSRAKTIHRLINKIYQADIIKKEIKKKYSKYKILIFDLPSYKNFLKNYHCKGQKIICIDYNGKKKIDLNFSTVKYSKKAIKNNVSINNIIIPKNNFKKKFKDFILITLGASDPKNITKKILNKILTNKKIKIKVILGKFNNNQKTFKKIITKNVKVFKNPSNYYKLQAECRYAITNGGMTMCELMFLGKKIFAIPKNNIEKKFCKIIKKTYGIEFGKIKNISLRNYNYIKKIKIGNCELIKEVKKLMKSFCNKN